MGRTHSSTRIRNTKQAKSNSLNQPIKADWMPDTGTHQAQNALELPRDRLAFVLRQCREASRKSLYCVAKDSGVEASNLWRMEQGERQNVTRETLLLISLGLVLDEFKVDAVVEMADQILDAAGLKVLRPLWESPDQMRSRGSCNR